MVANNADDLGQGGADATDRVRLSVILPVRNGEPFLGEQLRALAAQECSFPWELIVVDNGSMDSSADTARSFQSKLARLKVISEPRAGKSHALNTGRAASSGEYIVLVDADDVVGAGYLEAMAASLDHLEMVSGQLDLTLLNPPWAQDELLTPDRLTVFLDYLPYIPGALIGVRASSWQRIGDFDGDLLSAEDVDFTWRAHRLGVTMGMAPGAVLHYRRPTNAIENFRKARSYGRAHVWLFLRYRSLGQPRLSVRAELYLIKQAMGEMVRREGPWQWRMGWRLGLVEGHLEESIRRRVWYP
jgi:glycosyltransferase involved in cell wall biosynthesis